MRTSTRSILRPARTLSRRRWRPWLLAAAVLLGLLPGMLGCLGDRFADKLVVWYRDRYAAPADKAVVRLHVWGAMATQIMEVRATAEGLGLADQPIYVSKRAPDWQVIERKKSVDAYQDTREIAIPIPAGCKAFGPHPVRLSVAYKAAEWSSSHRFKVADRTSAVTVEVIVVPPKAKEQRRLQDAGLLAAILLGATLLLCLLQRLVRRRARLRQAAWPHVLGVLLWLAASAYWLLWPLVGTFGLVHWWVRVGAAVLALGVAYGLTHLLARAVIRVAPPTDERS